MSARRSLEGPRTTADTRRGTGPHAHANSQRRPILEAHWPGRTIDGSIRQIANPIRGYKRNRADKNSQVDQGQIFKARIASGELTLPRGTRKGLARCKKHGADRLSQFAHDAESIPGFSTMTRSVAEHAPLRKGISGMGPLQSTLHHADEGDRGERFEGKGSK